MRTACSVVGFALVLGTACGTRRAVDRASPCEALMSAPATNNECVDTECDWVWVTDSDDALRAAILNPTDVRLNGVAGVSVWFDDEQWRVFDQTAVHVERTAASSLTGLVLNCAQPTPALQPFRAQPLAPQVASVSGFELLAHLSSRELGAQAPYRGSDLTLLNEETLVLALGTGGLSVVNTGLAADGGLQPLAHVPAAPDEDFNDVVASNERYLFVASKRRGLVIWDLFDPSTPRFVADGFPQRVPQDGHSLLLRDNVLYLAQAPAIGTGGLWAFDVSEPTNPVELWHFVPEAGHDVHDVNVVEQRFYVSSLRGGLYIVRVDNPNDHDQEPQVIARAAIEVRIVLRSWRAMATSIGSSCRRSG